MNPRKQSKAWLDIEGKTKKERLDETLKTTQACEQA